MARYDNKYEQMFQTANVIVCLCDLPVGADPTTSSFGLNPKLQGIGKRQLQDERASAKFRYLVPLIL